MTDSFITVLPSAGRLMASLRDIGYDLSSAIADIVDNAIDAGAGAVAVEIAADAADSWIRVSDDGVGMNRARLDEAMRYGTRADYGSGALGLFGLGLKTASLSQCRRLTVASRSEGADAPTIRRWDLDQVLRTDTWALERMRPSSAPSRLLEPLANASAGTVVLWEHLDRVLPRKPTQGMTARVLRTAVDDIRAHLALVFHRFLDGEAYGRRWPFGRRRLVLTLNGKPIEPWDPFSRHEARTHALPPQLLEYTDTHGRTVTVPVKPYVLPGQQFFSSADAHRLAGGPKRWNRHQGFYIYRRERLIQAGGWNRLRTLDEHAKLARIAVDLPPGQEEQFAVDVAKMRVSVPEDLRAGLRAIASGAVAVAQERYRDHLDTGNEVVHARPMTSEAISLSRDWPAIMAVVDDVLGQQPHLRDRLLLRLANADADDTALLQRAP